VWHIWWMALAGLGGIAGTVLTHAWRVDGEIAIPARTIAAFEQAQKKSRAER
jgi:cytochrome o ubiquinol oxidase subunit I